jgi:hypothetical protein
MTQATAPSVLLIVGLAVMILTSALLALSVMWSLIRDCALNYATLVNILIIPLKAVKIAPKLV